MWTRAALSRSCPAGRCSCRRRRPRPSASPGERPERFRAAPALAQVRGWVRLSRVWVGSTLPSISGPQSGRNQGGVASSRLPGAASTHLLFVCHPYLQHGDLYTGCRRPMRRPERAMMGDWGLECRNWPLGDGMAGGRRPPAGVWEGPFTCRLWLQPC